VLVRRAVFDAIGGFDEGYFMYFEDVDLGYRLGQAGYRNVYEPSAVVVHTGAHSTKSSAESERMISAHHDSARRFLNRKYRGWWLWPVRVTLTIGLALRSALVRRRVARQ
jgi:N-acetylglucosaminyl-diphospho-decaprenol L-rhamnosyltransferase